MDDFNVLQQHERICDSEQCPDPYNGTINDTGTITAAAVKYQVLAYQ